MPPGQLHDDLDTHSLYGERPYGRTFKSLLTTTHATSLVQKCTVYTAALATRQLKSCIESLNVLDMTMLTRRQLTT